MNKKLMLILPLRFRMHGEPILHFVYEQFKGIGIIRCGRRIQPRNMLIARIVAFVQTVSGIKLKGVTIPLLSNLQQISAAIVDVDVSASDLKREFLLSSFYLPQEEGQFTACQVGKEACIDAPHGFAFFLWFQISQFMRLKNIMNLTMRRQK